MNLDNAIYSPHSALFQKSTIGFWQSCFTAFGTAMILPPPASRHYTMPPGANVKKPVTFLSSLGIGGGYFPSIRTFHNRQKNAPGFCNYRSLFGVDTKSNSQSADIDVKSTTDKRACPRIAIIGGGIAGITAAQAIAKRSEFTTQIVVFEGDTEGGHRKVNFDAQEQPVWTAATARNANGIVPGASMHIMSQRTTLLKVMKDTAREWYSEKTEQLRHWLNTELVHFRVTNINNFDLVPPYFSLRLFRCLGTSATWDERATFVTFLRHFLLTSILSGEDEANKRGGYIVQLAKSNRFSFLEALDISDDKELASKIGFGRGFLSLHRSHEGAMHAAKEGELFGERSVILPYEDAVKLEPRISKLPMKNLFAVHRLDDYTANSALYVQGLVKKIKSMGVEYRCNGTGIIVDISVIKNKTDAMYTRDESNEPGRKSLATSASQQGHRFKVTTKDGTAHEFDYIVLAAGVNSPLIARKLSAGDSCPTYPLRGYSLSLYTNHTHETDGNGRLQKGMSSNLLNRPMSVDDMYCSSVGPNMARIAGFGELVGYRDKAVDVPSLGPKVLSRYGRTLFPDSDASEKSALQCFRPMSPDDIPLVGEVSSVPGLFLHTGHGTLGWTLCLATSECVAQALCDKIQGIEDQVTYKLPGDITIDRAPLSPDRFL